MTEQLERLREALPRGGSLDGPTWERRHRLLSWLLLAHLPILPLVGVLRGVALVPLAAEVAAVGVVALVARVLRGRAARSMAVVAGLMLCSAFLVHLTGGVTEVHFHYFVMLGFIALYQDWRPYLLAIGFVVAHHGVVGVLAPGAVFADPRAVERPWTWALVHGGFVLFACLGHVLLWKLNERESERARRYYRELYEGERAMVAQLQQAEELKRELIAVVSHEFRTPLTSIIGFSQTLSARVGRNDLDTAVLCAQAIERHGRRLSRLVNSLLAASGDIPVQRDAVTDLHDIVNTVLGEVLRHLPGPTGNLAIVAPPGVLAAIGQDAAYQVVLNLLDNALKFADRDSTVHLRVAIEDDGVVLQVANVGAPLPVGDPELLFAPFVQGDSSDSRKHEGIGLGLHVVRKLVAAHGGEVAVRTDGRLTVFNFLLPAADRRESSAAAPQALRHGAPAQESAALGAARLAATATG